jgi:hypothetical protein
MTLFEKVKVSGELGQLQLQTGDLAMGALVQPYPTARTDWIYSTG